MSKDLEYTFLNDEDKLVSVPPPLKNAGLYSGDLTFTKKPWGNDYRGPKIEPDASKFASQFYAKHHIPSTNRPGNNALNTNIYQFYDKNKYNIECFNEDAFIKN